MLDKLMESGNRFFIGLNFGFIKKNDVCLRVINILKPNLQESIQTRFFFHCKCRHVFFKKKLIDHRINSHLSKYLQDLQFLK